MAEVKATAVNDKKTFSLKSLVLKMLNLLRIFISDLKKLANYLINLAFFFRRNLI